MAGNQAKKAVAQNKKARYDYFIDETLEAGIELFGTEVKSIRAGKSNLRDSYASIEGGEIYLKQMHISPYENGNIFNHDPLRPRRLLINRSEIRKLTGQVTQAGYSLVPLSLYLKGNYVKVELALVRGKKSYDKRASIAERDAKRKMDSAIKSKNA
ncbi:MAG: SsrA-binding protein SmpB [Clostridiales bacterium]|jgi:SsrA-binding protein|nr:SsrA-binding protein SmpB [Clostridiales bacterium]